MHFVVAILYFLSPSNGIFHHSFIVDIFDWFESTPITTGHTQMDCILTLCIHCYTKERIYIYWLIPGLYPDPHSCTPSARAPKGVKQSGDLVSPTKKTIGIIFLENRAVSEPCLAAPNYRHSSISSTSSHYHISPFFDEILKLCSSFCACELMNVNTWCIALVLSFISQAFWCVKYSELVFHLDCMFPSHLYPKWRMMTLPPRLILILMSRRKSWQRYYPTTTIILTPIKCYEIKSVFFSVSVL